MTISITHQGKINTRKARRNTYQRALPADFPPWSTVYNYFSGWEKAAVTIAMLDVLRDRARLRDGRAANPSTGIIDSQSVKAAETVCQSSRGYDAGKKINGRKRDIVTDSLGLLLCVLVTTAAAVQDRDTGRTVLKRDGGYAGKLVTWAADAINLTLEIVKRSDKTAGFQVLPRRWAVERTRAWIVRHRRSARDYERLPEHHEATVRWSMIRILSRRLTKPV